jgi:hypothetical protein
MAAIDDEQNDLDAAEGLTDLNRIALQDLPINRPFFPALLLDT